jgi:hypothetical protein
MYLRSLGGASLFEGNDHTLEVVWAHQLFAVGPLIVSGRPRLTLAATEDTGTKVFPPLHKHGGNGCELIHPPEPSSYNLVKPRTVDLFHRRCRVGSV